MCRKNGATSIRHMHTCKKNIILHIDGEHAINTKRKFHTTEKHETSAHIHTYRRVIATTDAEQRASLGWSHTHNRARTSRRPSPPSSV
jgi:hypothetical protein